MTYLVLLNDGLKYPGRCIYMTRRSSLRQKANDGVIKLSNMNGG